MPLALSESSGIISLNDGKTFWTHNDSGDSALLYEVDTTGKIIRRVTILNSQNIDWEDISTDNSHFIFIGDIGNNKQKRNAVQIYRIDIADLLSKVYVSPTVIQLNYANKGKKLKRKQKDFDTEAICVIDGNLFLFSKNWSHVIHNYTLIYKMDTAKSVQNMYPFQKLKYTKGFFAENQIAGACYNVFDQRVYLISASKIFCLHKEADSFLIKKVYSFDFLSQKEAICPLSGNRFAISQESNALLHSKASIYIIQL